MTHQVRLLGGLTERAGASTVEVEIPPDTTVGQLRLAVAHQHPRLAPLLGSVKVAVDHEVATDDATVPVGAEVALLPPVAGGSDPTGVLSRVRVGEDGRRRLTGLVEGRLDASAATAAIAGPEVGGTAAFVGAVRDHAPDLDAPVVRLDYSAYPEMAERVLAGIAEELLDEHPALRGVALLHAVGALEVGQHTVLIACAAAHRATAFDACRDGLERVKDRVPVFKREVTADGDHRWVGLPEDDSPAP